VIQVQNLSHRYGERTALDDLSFNVERGELFGVLGPNGGGKSTLFRVLSTLVLPQTGHVSIDGMDAATNQAGVRRKLGVVFQSPALDPMLTVGENLTHQGHLYGLRGSDLAARIDRLAGLLGVTDRLKDRVDALSGGLRRRAEIAKALLHDPELLLLDEPTHGLDPRARRDLWDLIGGLRAERGITVAVTTHLLDEAEHCARLLILDEGKLQALDAPAALKREIPGEFIWLDADDPEALLSSLSGIPADTMTVTDGRVRITTDAGARLAGEILSAHHEAVTSLTVARPSLEDVFLARTGHRLEEVEEKPAGKKRRGRR